MKNDIIKLCVVGAALLCVNTVNVAATDYYKVIKSDVTLNLNGETLETNGVDILNVNGNTYVPLRFLSESAGLEVIYDGDTQAVDINSSEELNLSSKLQATSLEEIQNKINELANISELNESISSYLMTLESQGIYIEKLNINNRDIKATPSDIEKAILTIAEKEIQLESLSITAGSKTKVIDVKLRQR